MVLEQDDRALKRRSHPVFGYVFDARLGGLGQHPHPLLELDFDLLLEPFDVAEWIGPRPLVGDHPIVEAFVVGDDDARVGQVRLERSLLQKDSKPVAIGQGRDDIHVEPRLVGVVQRPTAAAFMERLLHAAALAICLDLPPKVDLQILLRQLAHGEGLELADRVQIIFAVFGDRSQGRSQGKGPLDIDLGIIGLHRRLIAAEPVPKGGVAALGGCIGRLGDAEAFRQFLEIGIGLAG